MSALPPLPAYASGRRRSFPASRTRCSSRTHIPRSWPGATARSRSCGTVCGCVSRSSVSTGRRASARASLSRPRGCSWGRRRLLRVRRTRRRLYRNKIVPLLSYSCARLTQTVYRAVSRKSALGYIYDTAENRVACSVDFSSNLTLLCLADTDTDVVKKCHFSEIRVGSGIGC